MPWYPAIAQADISRVEDLAAFRDQLLEQSMFMAWLYGSVFLAGFALLTLFTLRIQTRPLSWSGPLTEFASRPWTWRHAAFILCPLILLQIVFVLVYGTGDESDDFSAAGAEQRVLMLQGLLFHGAGLLLILAVMRKYTIRWSDGFGVRLAGWLRHTVWGMLILLGCMPVLLSYNLAANVVMEWWGIEPHVQDVTRIISGADGWMEKMYFVVLAVVVAPLVEELLFRGILLPALSRLAGVRFALVAVALLFSLVHGFYMPAFFVFFILSVAFSLAYIYRGSLVVPVVMHALFNGLTMVVLLHI